MKQIALIDIGSNTIRLVIYELDHSQDSRFKQEDSATGSYKQPTNALSAVSPTRLFSKKRMVGLAGYVDKDNNLSDDGVTAACGSLKYLQKLCDALRVRERYFFATASLRNIGNSKQVCSIIEQTCNISIDLISSKDEALLGYAAFKHDAPFESGLLCDVGGGSTELVCFEEKSLETKQGKPNSCQAQQVQAALSMPIGSLKLFKRHVSGILPSKAEIKAMKTDALEMIKISCKEQDLTSELQLCAIGGSARAIKKLANSFHGLNEGNKKLSQEQIKELADVLYSANKKARKLILQNCPDRAHTIVPGLIILEEVIEIFNTQRIYISNYGIREGYLYQRLLATDDAYC